MRNIVNNVNKGNIAEMKNPIDVFIDTFADTPIRTRVFAFRPLAGSINASIVGLCNQHITNNQPKEASGIDGLNEAIAKATEEREADILAPAGTTPRAEPLPTAMKLRGVVMALGREMNLTDELFTACDNIASTVDYMSKPRDVLNTMISQMAKALDLDTESVEAAVRKQYARDAQIIATNKDAILDIIESFGDKLGTDGISDFDELPVRQQVRISNLVLRCLENQTQYAITTVMRGKLDAATDIAIFRDAQKQVTEWQEHMTTTDPEFAMALVQAA